MKAWRGLTPPITAGHCIIQPSSWTCWASLRRCKGLMGAFMTKIEDVLELQVMLGAFVALLAGVTTFLFVAEVLMRLS